MRNEKAEIENVFKETAKKYGFEEADIEFAQYREVKIKWKRTKDTINMTVADYFETAPAEIIGDVAETVLRRIRGEYTDYNKNIMRDWLQEEKNLKRNQAIYLKRSRNITRTTVGEYRDLKDSIERLIERRLIKREHLENVVFTWTKGENIRRVGYCSVMMKVVAISSIFDNKIIPEFVLDYVVYHEMIHIIQNGEDDRKHGIMFKHMENMYPEKEEAEEELRKLHLYV